MPHVTDQVLDCDLAQSEHPVFHHHSFTSEEIAVMEKDVMTTLEWRIGCFTAADFIDQMLVLARVGRNAGGMLRGNGQTAIGVRAAAHRMLFDSLHGLCTLRYSPP